jgi:hypothetical protein
VNINDRNWNLWRRSARLAAIVLTSTAAWFGPARAQTVNFSTLARATSGQYALFQYASITGSGDTITASWVPVVTSSGTTLYENVTLQFDVDSSGNLTLAKGSPTVVPAPIIQVSSFVPGIYVGPSNVGGGNACITVSGPGATTGGETEWSLAASPGSWTYTYPASATWYVGPLNTSPLAPRLQAANITSTDYSYGVVGSEPWIEDGTWYTNTLIGLSQTGSTLTIVSFTPYSTGKDQNTPVDEITYTQYSGTTCP